jgi:exopolyphosphatase/guanosine-5'-triphosphate,3'-diphosphate pyrophosphatase
MRVSELNVLATAATREAENGPAFIAQSEAICGVPVTVLSGADEARIAALGVVAGIMDPDGVAGDLGGGSLELTEVTGRQIGNGDSLLLGGLRLHTSSKGSLKAARELARAALASSSVVGKLQGRTFYAVGGTWRSLARLHMHHRGYPLHVMHEYRIGANELEEFLKLIARGSLETIPGINVVSKQRKRCCRLARSYWPRFCGRAGRIPCASRLSACARACCFRSSRQRSRPRIRFCRPRGNCPFYDHARRPMRKSLSPGPNRPCKCSAGRKRRRTNVLRAAACLLADIGWRAHPDYRGAQSFNIISHAGFVGIDHPGRAYLALSVYYRHAGLSDDELAAGLRELAPLRYRESARALAASFRVAYLVSGAVEGILPHTS